MALLPATALTPCDSPSAPRLPGTWKLGAGRAVTIAPREAGILKVAHGSVWATFDGPHARSGRVSGDHFLSAGEQLRVQRGQRVVIEAWNRSLPAYFSWDPMPAVARRPVPARAAVLQPLADLRLALVFGTRAFGRLLAGLGQLAWQAAFGPPRERLAEPGCSQGITG